MSGRKYDLQTGESTGAPPEFKWLAWWGDYDAADDYTPLTGSGPTEEAAIIDLVSNHDLPEGEAT